MNHVRVYIIKVAAYLLQFFNFRFYYHVCKLINRRNESDGVIQMGNARFSFPLDDPYWSRLISKHFKYENEIDIWLGTQNLKEVAFVDCGANIGYWTVRMNTLYHVNDLISIEPNPQILKYLIKNEKYFYTFINFKFEPG